MGSRKKNRKRKKRQKFTGRGYEVVWKTGFRHGRQYRYSLKYMDGIPVEEWIEKNADPLYWWQCGDYEKMDAMLNPRGMDDNDDNAEYFDEEAEFFDPLCDVDENEGQEEFFEAECEVMDQEFWPYRHQEPEVNPPVALTWGDLTEQEADFAALTDDYQDFIREDELPF